MSGMNDVFDVFALPGEPARLDYIIREHEKLKQQVEILTALLVAKGIMTSEALSDAAEAMDRKRRASQQSAS